MGNKEKFLKLVSQSDKDWAEKFGKEISEDNQFVLNTKVVLRIIDFMDERGFKQVDLAKLLGTSPQHVNKLLRGGENMTLETVEKYGRILGVKLVDMDDDYISKEYECSLDSCEYSSINMCFNDMRYGCSF